MRRGTRPGLLRDDARFVVLLVRGARVRGGGDGALDFSSACSSRLQIGQLAVRRLWRQKRDTDAEMVVAARAPRPRPRAAPASPSPAACAPRAGAARGAR